MGYYFHCLRNDTFQVIETNKLDDYVVEEMFDPEITRLDNGGGRGAWCLLCLCDGQMFPLFTPR